ncbi:MAG: hypothetical protein IJ261_05370 [Clostridia bacterium]|nr:hypothetical protein [Clostridia bacterium]
MADSISAMPKEIANWLSKQTKVFSDIKFLTEFPAIPKATPLRHTIVSVGLESVKITDYFTENSDGELVPSEYCRRADIKIRFSVYVPYSAGGTACHEAFTKIVDCLNFKSDLNLIESGCDAITADRDTDAFVMKSWVIIEAQFCPAESSSVQYESFLPKTLLCGSHINNSLIHVTTEEKEAWSNQSETGAYFGTGESSQTISLGFKPSFVIVCAAFIPMFSTDDDGKSYCYAGIATKNYSSSGIAITSSGFRLTQTSSTSYGNTYSQLNKLGVDYSYIAFK